MILDSWEILDISNDLIIFTRFITTSNTGKSSAIIVGIEQKRWRYKIRYISNYSKEGNLIYRDLSVYESWSLGFAKTKELAMLYADLKAIEMGYKIKDPLSMTDYPIY